MKISELSDRSGLTVQTIKFYLREGLMPKGAATGATRAEYGDAHLERLRLIRALREVGDLPVSAIKRIVGAVDDTEVGLHELLGRVQYAIGPHVEIPADDPLWRAAREDVDALIAELGWRVTADAPARDLLAQTFVALRKLGFPVVLTELRPYIEAAVDIGEHEAGRLSTDEPRSRAIHGMLVTTVLYEQVLLALHRLAQEHASARRLG
ncbi:MerR family transcriptional regulator [Actinomadura sp. HBU206391]|uniref:MerR family transcriptional regulator n=1 Tax=Actinomadura sp. HBU206391 TaxID=2731692 RepID=UPI00164FC52F|nr:MerR family transcriptional regulator [Actinomadura sp. HBU206391]MBC6461430.1 MerR family transcriptional regulator [Actinomadura sp. HBU206391]